MKPELFHKPFDPPNLLRYMLRHTRVLAAYLSWRILSILVTVPFPVITQRIVDRSIPNRDYAGMCLYTCYGLLLLLIHYGAMRIALKELSSNLQVMMRAMRARIFQKLQFMHFGFLDKTQTGRLLSKYAFDTQHIEGAMIPILFNVIPETVRALALTLVLTWVDPWLTAFVLLTVPVFAIVRISYFKRIRRSNRAVRLARERLTGQASEFISAIKLVRGFGQEPEVRGNMENVSDDYSASRQQQMMVNQSMNVMVFMMFTGLNLLAVAFGGFLAIQGVLTIGAIIALVSALPVILNPINLYTQVSIQYLLGSESYQSIKEVMDSGYVEKWQGKEKPSPLRGKIEFEHVRFHYPEKEELVLHDLDLTIEPGEHVAFVGPSGSGKSTTVNLLLGLYAPSEGVIRIDGVPQERLGMRYLRRNSAIVMQDNILLSGTLFDNIRFGRPEATNNEVVEAARLANAMEFIEQLPEGLDTKVGERGVSLSGGQRQRIAIARALLRDPKILILDEATSALDYESETLVQEALNRLAKNRTTLTIAHRLSTVRRADRIVVLSHGRMVESGPYQELARREGGAFHSLLTAQGEA
ncbi:MAG: ATP-binding cassette domain-containing protein [Verrucomicrobia bacterium]|jgi:ABC-type multidrug transport system fused ATPase/permease subunit|nr:ATP-binding cassette domain-containing protein [Verrucomicrobiota bacterium]